MTGNDSIAFLSDWQDLSVYYLGRSWFSWLATLRVLLYPTRSGLVSPDWQSPRALFYPTWQGQGSPDWQPPRELWLASQGSSWSHWTLRSGCRETWTEICVIYFLLRVLRNSFSMIFLIPNKPIFENPDVNLKRLERLLDQIEAKTKYCSF